MTKKEFLNEEKYKQSEAKIKKTALIILIAGISLGVLLISIGLIKQLKINARFSEESKAAAVEKLEKEKQTLQKQLEEEEKQVIAYQEQLENKIKPIEDEIKKLDRTKFTGFDDAYYEREDRIDELKKSIEKDKKSLNVIEDVLDDDSECSFSTAKNNEYTTNYCKIKNDINAKTYEIEHIDDEFSEFDKRRASHGNVPFYIFGSFLIITSLMISGSVYMVAKRRDILAFTTQQIMPVTQEGIEKMTPTIGKSTGTIVKEITKGIKEGLKEENNKK